MKIRILNSGTQTEVRQVDLNALLAEGGSCFVGRSPNSGLVLDSPNVSRLHGKLARREGQIYFSDLGSTNGSMVQEQIATVNQGYALHSGDIVYIGGFTLLFEDVISDDPVAEADADELEELKDEPTNAASDEPEEPVEVVEAELVPESSGAIVPYQSGSITPSLEIRTQALLNVVRRRAIADLRITGKFTREAFLKAAQTAKESIEEHVDQEQLEQEIEKYWQSMTKTSAVIGTRLGESATKGASELGSRLGAAAKAAWKEFVTAPQQEKPSSPTAALEDASPDSSLAETPGEDSPAAPATAEKSNPANSTELEKLD
ncbi:FHA domain-containing protein [Phormidium tenue FACHB-886]|nr:FHA domain-containing protein [Phormidium tenue FACHB-886]